MNPTQLVDEAPAGVGAPLIALLGRLGVVLGEPEASLLIEAADAPLAGHTCVEIADPALLASCAACPAVEVVGVPAHGDLRPFVLDGNRMYLRRQYEAEVLVATRLSRIATAAVAPLGDAGLPGRLFPGSDPDPQRAAVERAVSSALTVIVGGPGTGKTYTVARLLATLLAGPGDPPSIALCAPTGKAAARVAEAIRGAVGQLEGQLDDAVIERLGALDAVTLHRLLEVDPGNRTRFRHHRRNPLPVDVVVVDEASMVSLEHAAALLDAIGPNTRLVLVGDDQQLASVDAGGVLADIVATSAGPVSASVVRLQVARRFATTSGIARLAAAIASGRPASVIEVLEAAGREGGVADVEWIDRAVGAFDRRTTPEVHDLLESRAAQLVADASLGRAREVLDCLAGMALLVPLRQGPFGVAGWNAWVEQHRELGTGRLGRPYLVTANDRANRLSNGDVAVIVRSSSGSEVAVLPGERADAPRELPPVRLAAIEPVHALTVHKSQGSEYEHVVVCLPPDDQPLLTRELLYTAVTRAKRRLTIAAPRKVIEAAVDRPTRRRTGLVERLQPAKP